MSGHAERAIADLARHQHALVTRRQALAAGLSAKAVRARIARGVWESVHPGVHRIAGAPRTWDQRAMAAVLAVGNGALVSRRCAAHLWSLDGFRAPGMIDVTIPRGVRVRAPQGVRVHDSTVFDLADPRRRRGIPVTGPARTVLDVCAAVGRDPETALAALDGTRRHGTATWSELWETLALHSCRGRNGVALFREVLLDRWGTRPPGGHFESVVLRLIAAHGLPAPSPEHEVAVRGRRYRIDLAFVRHLVAIELDGKQVHLQDDAFESDRSRQNQLEIGGWLVLRFTWRRVVEDPAGVIAEIRAALLLRQSLLVS